MNEPKQESAHKPKTASTGEFPPKSFLWHFAPKIKELDCPEPFSHDHWWGAQPDTVPLDEAMWELFRRHPVIPTLLKRIHQRVGPDATLADRLGIGRWLLDNMEYCLARFCCQAWPQMEMVDFACWELFFQTTVAPQNGFQGEVAVGVLNSWRVWGKSPTRAEKHLQSQSVNWDRAGRLLLVVDPFAKGLGQRVERLAAVARRGAKQRRAGKARVGQWLTVIEEFEKAEARGDKRDNQLFARYRRVIAGCQWTCDRMARD